VYQGLEVIEEAPSGEIEEARRGVTQIPPKAEKGEGGYAQVEWEPVAAEGRVNVKWDAAAGRASQSALTPGLSVLNVTHMPVEGLWESRHKRRRPSNGGEESQKSGPRYCVTVTV